MTDARVWPGYFPDIRAGQLYGYRVYGPYAKSLRGAFKWTDAHFGYVGHKNKDLSLDTRNNAAAMPKCEVVDTAFTWGQDIPPRRQWHETIICGTHVRSFTANHKTIKMWRPNTGAHSPVFPIPVSSTISRTWA